MYKKIISIVIALTILFSTFSFADTQKNKDKEKVYNNTESILVVDFETSKTILAKKPFERKRISGLTKLMIFLVAMDEIKLNKEKMLNDKIIISSKDIPINSKIDIKEGDIFTLESLIKIMLLTESKEAPKAIGHHFSLTEEIFVKKMNSKAKKLGLIDTKFFNTTGETINGKYNYSTALDLYKLTNYILKKYPLILYYTTQKNVSLPNKNKTIKSNLSSLIDVIPYSDGLKRTHDKQGNESFIGTYIVDKDKKEPYRIIAITLSTKKGANNPHKYIFDYIRKNIHANDIKRLNSLQINEEINNSKEKPVSLRQVIYALFK